MLPSHPTEIDRLDVHHYALRAELRGNHVAPVGRPATILDVGTGTGQWAYELCAEFPDAMVVGVDLVPRRVDERPANYRFVKANVLQGLPFKEGSLDFVHQPPHRAQPDHVQRQQHGVEEKGGVGALARAIEQGEGIGHDRGETQRNE